MVKVMYVEDKIHSELLQLKAKKGFRNISELQAYFLTLEKRVPMIMGNEKVKFNENNRIIIDYGVKKDDRRNNG